MLSPALHAQRADEAPDEQEGNESEGGGPTAAEPSSKAKRPKTLAVLKAALKRQAAEIEVRQWN